MEQHLESLVSMAGRVFYDQGQRTHDKPVRAPQATWCHARCRCSSGELTPYDHSFISCGEYHPQEFINLARLGMSLAG